MLKKQTLVRTEVIKIQRQRQTFDDMNEIIVCYVSCGN